MTEHKKRIVIIGSTPPPIGGVSIHISRLLDILDEKYPEYEVKVHDPIGCSKKWGRLNIFCHFISIVKANGDVYHLHKPDHRISFWYILLFLSILGKKTIFTLHNENIADQVDSGLISHFKLFSLRQIFKRFSHIICVNRRTADMLVSQGVSDERVSVIPAFIPQQNVGTASLPDEMISFSKSHTPILIGYSHRIYLYKGYDRYGGDMMLELIRRLSNDYPKVGLMLVIPSQDGATLEGIEKYKIFIEDNGIEDNVFLCNEIVDLTALFSYSDIHIRPSNTDGDPIAVRESLYINLPTIASDCTYKPEGTIFHKDRDHDDFEKQTRNVIENIEKEREKLTNLSKETFGEDVITLYKKYLGA